MHIYFDSFRNGVKFVVSYVIESGKLYLFAFNLIVYVAKRFNKHLSS